MLQPPLSPNAAAATAPATPGAATPAARPPAAPFVLATRAVAVVALLALIVLGLAWELWLAPTGSRTLAIKVLPLLLPLPGLLKMRLYTYRWVSLVIWLYFIEGAVRANGLELGPTRALAWAQVALCLVLFTACTAHVRWRLKHKTTAEL